MRTAGRFRAETAYEESTDKKANMNTPIMAVVTQVGGVVAVPNRANYYWIILVNDPNRQTICYSSTGVVLSNGDVIYVAKARDRDLSHYEFVAFVADAGGGVIPPTCPKWAQVVTVSMNACQYATLGAAITYINALPAGLTPGAAQLFLIQVMAGNYAEGAITIPQYCTVMGRGEATEIQLGANSLLMSSDTSLQNVVVESSNAAYAIGIVGQSNVILRNVRAIQTAGAGTPDPFHISAGSTGVYLYDCVGEVPADGAAFHVIGASTATFHTCTAIPTGAYSAATYGFQVGDTATVVMDYCTADHANFADALHLDDAGLTCTTRWCTFLAHDDDVNILGTNPNWFHLSCDFDPDNSTIVAGTHFADPTKRFNQTVIVAEFGGDFQLLSEATAWVAAQADHAAGKLYTILMLGGNFTEAGNVTIPTFTHVVGMNDGTEIELGAFSIIMSADSGLFNVKVESSDLSHAIDCNGVTGVWLRHVYVVTTSTGGCLYVHGASDVQVHDCVFEVALNTWSVYVTDSATLLLDHCIVEGGAGVGGYGLFLIGTSTVTAKWSEFEGYVPIYIGATATFNHIACQFDPNFTPAGAQWIAGRHHALPTKRFNQTVIVAEEGGDFQALSEAVKWINNLADAAAGNLYGVLMLAGNFAEAATVTIPQYVHVFGMGEGTEIEMAANQQLILSAHSSLQNVVVEGDPGVVTGLVYANNAANVVLRNVHAIESTVGGYAFYFSGTTDVRCYDCLGEASDSAGSVFVATCTSALFRDCRAEATAVTCLGFNLGGTGVLDLYGCTANDTTNFQTALNIGNTACTVNTWHCVFRAAPAGNDVQTGAASIWQHMGCQFDPDNCTIAGTETPLVTGQANFDDVVTFENGVTFDGLPTQNIITIPDNLVDAFHIIDDGAGDVFFKIITTTGSEEVIFNDGEDDVNFRVAVNAGISDPTYGLFVDGATGDVAIGPLGAISGHLRVHDPTVNTTATFYGAQVSHTKTAGVTNVNDHMYGMAAVMVMNQVGGEVGNFRGMHFVARLTTGNVGSAITGRFFQGLNVFADLDGGRIFGDLFGANIRVDQEAANTVDDDVYGLFVDVDLAGTVSGISYMVYLDEKTGVDYGIYQAATGTPGVNHLAGLTSIGGTVAPLAQLHVDQSNAVDIPVLLLDQARLTQAFIEFTTTVGAGNPVDTAAHGAYYGKVRVMVTGVGFKSLALYEES